MDIPYFTIFCHFWNLVKNGMLKMTLFLVKKWSFFIKSTGKKVENHLKVPKVVKVPTLKKTPKSRGGLKVVLVPKHDKCNHKP